MWKLESSVLFCSKLHAQLTGVSSQACSTKFLSTETSVTFISNKASLIPTQFLLPIPNGAQAH